jgi:hypothetical protein
MFITNKMFYSQKINLDFKVENPGRIQNGFPIASWWGYNTPVKLTFSDPESRVFGLISSDDTLKVLMTPMMNIR